MKDVAIYCRTSRTMPYDCVMRVPTKQDAIARIEQYVASGDGDRSDWKFRSVDVNKDAPQTIY